MELIIRADASTQIGTGHVMRCLALAQAWQDAGGKVTFVMATETQVFKTRLKTEEIEIIHLSVQPGSIEDAQETANLGLEYGVTGVVLDGYHFGASYQKIIKDAGLCLLFIDDYGHAEHYYADYILNQNIYAQEDLYQNREQYSQLLLGNRFALLRQEFWQWSGWKREIPKVAQNVLVSLGGSDPDNVTLKVIQGLQKIKKEKLEVVVVVGGDNPHYEKLQSVSQNSNLYLNLQRNVTNISELMAWANIAVSASGSTSWELAFMGLPSLLLILADNQKYIAEELDRINVAINLGWHQNISSSDIAEKIQNLLTADQIRRMISEQGQELVDGYGAARIAAILAEAQT